MPLVDQLINKTLSYIKKTPKICPLFNKNQDITYKKQSLSQIIHNIKLTSAHSNPNCNPKRTI